jgi:hypothetical protein
MSGMTPDKATALRRPFPQESIGKLPKGGTMLDYVGHAAVTDRLLTIDPEWSWDFLAYTPDGIPVTKDSEGNLWIKLTICGVTRIGVGDGKSAKERIGDAIRNAAMRFGVALDLWAKEDLVEFAQAAHAAPAPPRPAPAPAPRHEAEKPGEVDGGDPMSAKTRGRLFALFAERGIDDKDEQIRGITHVIGRPIESRSELTEDEGRAVIARLTGASA